MIKKLLFLILLIGCLAGNASAVVEIQGGTVSSYNMNVAGETYIMGGDVTATGTAFTVGANNVTFDGNGHTISFGSSSDNSYGVIASSRPNFTLKNVNIINANASTGSSHGIFLSSSNNSTILNVTSDSPSGYGLLVVSGYCTIDNISCVSNSNYGIYILNSLGNYISNSSGTSTATRGIRVAGSSNNNFVNVTGRSTNSIGFLLDGSSQYNILNNCLGISTSNTGLYIDSAQNNGVINSYGNSTSGTGIHVNGVSNFSVANSQGNSVSGSGILLSSVTGGTVTNCRGVSSNYIGTYILSSSGISIVDSACISNTSNAIQIKNSNTIYLENCTGSSTANIGAYFNNSNNCTFSNGTAQSSTYTGLQLETSSVNNIFSTNLLKSTSASGIWFDTTSYSNTFTGNVISSPIASYPHNSKHIMMVGNSIVAGSNNAGFPPYANITLHTFSSGWTVSNRGIGGNLASDVKNRIDTEISLFHPHILVIKVGTNDLVEARAQQDIIDDILWTANRAKTLGILPIICTEIPRSTENNLRIWLDQNLTTQAIALGYTVINSYDAIDSTPGNGQYDNYVDSSYQDGVHPTDEGNQLIGPVVARGIYYSHNSSVISGTAPLSIKFNTVADNCSWYWDFENDGTIDSTLQNPIHTYGKAGTYSVNLTIQNEYGNFSTVKTDYITVTAQTPPSTIDEIWNILRHWFFGLAAQEAAS